MAADGDRPRGLGAALVLAAGVGALLRCWGLGAQIVAGDELHAVRSAVSHDLGAILTTYRLADTCLPLTALLRSLYLLDVPLTEWTTRFPALVAGLTALVVVPVGAGCLAGRRVAVVLGWLVALSPGLVFYSRIARPYAIIVLLGAVAVFCFVRFWDDGLRPRWGIAYAATAAAAVWFHPGAAPFVCGPLPVAAIDLVLLRESAGRRRRLTALVGASGLFAALVLVFLVPAWESFTRLLRTKGDAVPITSADFGDLVVMQAGVEVAAVAVPFWLITLWGLWTLSRTRPRVAAFTGVPVLAQGLALALVRPTGIDHILVLNRYLLIALPAVLLWTAVGLVDLWSRRGPRVGRLGRIAVVALGGALLAANPYLRDPQLRLGPFGGSNSAGNFVTPSPVLPPQAVSEVYRLIGREPGGGKVVETSEDPVWARLRAELALWRIHGRPVVIAATDPRLRDPGVRFRTLVAATPEAIEASGARFVVVDLQRPLKVRISRASTMGFGVEEMLEIRPARPRNRHVITARELEREFRRAWGLPQLVDGTIRIWDFAATTSF